MINIPPDFLNQIIDFNSVFLKSLYPFIFSILGLLIFVFAIKVIITKLLHPISIFEGAKKKILLGLLVAAFTAFMVWLYQQPPGFQKGVLLPVQFLYGFLTANKALTTLATTLIGIILTAILL